MLPHRHDVELIWEEGGVSAPVELFVQHIIMALTSEQQEQVLTAVIEEIERRNEALKTQEVENDGDDIQSRPSATDNEDSPDAGVE